DWAGSLLAQRIVLTDTPKRWAIPVSVSPARTLYFLSRPLPSAIEVLTAIGLTSVPSWRNGPRIAPALGSRPLRGPPSCSPVSPMRLAPLAVAEASAWEASSPVGPEPSFPPAPAPANPATARRGPGPFPSGPPTDPELEAPGAQLAYVATMTIRMTMAGSSASGPTRTRERMAPRRLNRRADVTRCPPVVDLIDWPVAT